MSDVWLNMTVDPDQGRVEMSVYIGARVAGKDPTEVAASVHSFIEDAEISWASIYAPKRSELFASLERTIFDQIKDDGT